MVIREHEEVAWAIRKHEEEAWIVYRNNDDEGTKIIDSEDREDHALVRSKFVQVLTKAGCKWASGKLLPWKGLPTKLVKSGVRGLNYPLHALIPGEE
ncbi:hypothetical protein HYDPIDRAFT_34619 [Hydnomerulius pinastri MD-312]|uniref:Uncharacterized protein n=1 Tax=Hydnomerulius pinastri MD-312 TaxID=994086 RepID=A0A0C9UY67_9AGAM|nr:hypothetical protein HYDPIDRAFT_34619 [Hydnomerulius pinastri MD-312]